MLERIVGLVPDDWLADAPAQRSPDEPQRRQRERAAYVDHFLRRLAAPRAFVTEAIDARHADV